MEQLELLEEVTLDSLSSENINKILPYLSNINALNLVNFKSPIEIDLASDLQLPSIEKIRLHNSVLSSKNLFDLMSKSKNLSAFIMYGGRINDNYSLEALRLSKFKKLKLGSCTFSKGNYQQILKNNKISKVSWAGGAVVSNTLTEINPSNLSAIKSLEIKNCTCDESYLNEMFTVLPQLEHVIFTGGTIKKFKNTFSLSSLKTLQIDLERFNDIASAFNDIEIEKIILEDNLSRLVPNLSKIKLSHLKYLAIKKNKISHLFLKGILSKSIALHHLNLHGCKNLRYLDKSIHFSNIDTLNLSETDISEESLKTILQNAPKLKRLDLSGCKNLVISPETKALLLDKQVYYPNHIKSKVKKPFYDLYNPEGETPSGTPQFDLERLLSNFSNISDPNKTHQNEFGKSKPAPSGKSGESHSDNHEPESLDTETKPVIGSLSLSEFGKSKPAPVGKSDESHSDNHEPEGLDTKTKPGMGSLSQVEGPNGTQNLDADTSDPVKTEMNVDRIFFPINPTNPIPDVSQYREVVYNELEINPGPCSITNPFLLKRQGDLELIACDSIIETQKILDTAQQLIPSSTHNIFYGKTKLALTQKWQPLPSLNPQEKLTHYQIHPDTADIEIQYSKRDNQYYIRSKNTEKSPITLEYLIDVPMEIKSLPSKVQSVVDEFIGTTEKDGYGEGELNISNPMPTGDDYMDAIISQKKGACRHRSAAFKHLMEQQYPEINVRIMSNHVHMQPEVLIDDEWIPCNLGGYPMELNINESNQPTFTKDHASQSQTKSHEKYEDEGKIARYLQTWKTTKDTDNSIEQYCKKLLETRQEKKYLIQTANKNVQQALNLAIKQYCKEHNKPFFYIDKPDDLTCSAPFVTKEKSKGIIKDGPGGPLYEFLIKDYDEENPPILLINYEQFDADDIVHHNSLFEDNPKADGTPLPPGTIILNLMNLSNPKLYQGEDIISRMDKVEACPISDKVLKSAYPELTLKSHGDESRPSSSINLFQAEHWKDILLGHWIINENNLHFEEGVLKKALLQHDVINIQNGLWDEPSYQVFWQEALINRYIDYEGERINLPPNFDIVVEEGYDWKKLKERVLFIPGCNLSGEVLNPNQFSLYFSKYQDIESNKSLQKIPGIIENYAGKTLTINLTREINVHEWAMLLSECNKHKVNIVCHCLAAVTLPEPLNQIEVPSLPETLPEWDKSLPPLLMIKSNDRDTTVHQLTKKFENYEFIDVSELEASDLIDRLNGSYDKNSHRFEFTKIQMVLSKALSANKKIILTGTFSNSLLDSLMPILLERANNLKAEGVLALVFDENNKYSLPNLVGHKVQKNEKLEILKTIYPEQNIQVLTQDQIQEEELSQLRARVRFSINNSKQIDTSNAWDGLFELSNIIQLPAIDLSHSEEKTREIIKTRLQMIFKMLSQSPLVYLSGLTGVGKTTFVEKYLSNLPDVNLYIGEEKLSEWAEDKSDKLKVIFIDEANIGKRQWSEFEGLFLDSPSIVSNGKRYVLSKDHSHVAIFAGNPLNYGSERQLSPLFKRHGNALVFEPMTGEFIFEKILKPLFENTSLEKNAEEISLVILSVYQYLIKLSTTEILISSRELQMMVLLTLSYHHQHPEEDARWIAKHYAYQIGKTMVPYENAKEFNSQFKPLNPLYAVKSDSFILKNTNYLLTPSRQEIYHLLTDLLNLRHFKQFNYTNDAQKFGGIGGLILEGEPGIGKSELVSAIFAEHNFTEGTLKSTPEDEDTFYRVPISMRNEEKQSLLLRGLNKAAGLIIDEINSAPFS